MISNAETVEAPTEQCWRAMALALHAQGLGVTEIGRRVRRHNNTISAFLHQEGVRQRIIPDRSWHPIALALADEGKGPSEVARQLGLTKNMVSGFFDRKGIKFPELVGIRSGHQETDDPEVSTIWTRMQSLHDNMDRVLAETRKRKSHIEIIHKRVAEFA